MTLQASNESDGTRPILEINNREQITRERTCRRNPVIFDWKESDVGRTDPEQMEMSDVVTSMHSSRSNSAQEERSLEEKIV